MTRIPILLLLAVAALAPPAALAHSHKKKGLEIVHPWTPAMEDRSARTTQVFMTIRNRGRAADRLLSATSPAAEKTELRQPTGPALANQPGSTLAVAAGQTLELDRKGPHLVLTGVKKQLHAYGSFKMTLVFEKAGRMVVDVVVEEAATEAPHKH